jgi:hypothetical protein
MVRGLLRLLSVIALVVSASAAAYGQGSSSISGVVTDTAGGTVPGASVTVTNDATKATLEGVTNSSGQFSFPAIPVGTYTVKVTLSGFKAFIANDVRVLGSQPANVPVTLAVGALTEQVEVKAGTELVQTSSNSVTSTLSVEHLNNLPLSSRNALYAVALLPGVSASGATVPARPASTACRTTPSTSRSTASAPATCSSRPTGSSRWSRRAWTRSKRSRSPARCPAPAPAPARSRSR